MMHLMRLTLTLLALATAGLALAEKPNILLIMADDVGDQAIGVYGGTSFATPRIDRLAASGLRFSHCYSFPVCHPTRIAIMTGKYPFRVGHPAWGTFPKEEEAVAIGHALKDAGYATAVAGKWQLTMLRDEPDHPHQLGFDEYSLFGWHEGPRYYQPMIYQNGKVRADVEHRYGPDVYVEFLIDFMRRNRGRPFFAYYPMALAHDVTNDIGKPPPLGPQGHYDSYRNMIEGIDERVGRLVDAIEEMGLRERTLILFTADNGTPKSYYYTAQDGEMFKEKVRFRADGQTAVGGKGELTDAGTRVALIANWPGVIEGPVVVDDLVDFSDFLPTFIDVAGGPKRSGLDGISFAARLRSDGPGKRKWAFTEYRGRRWVRNQHWKLYDDGRLYDMSDGRSEEEPALLSAGDAEAGHARDELTSAFRELRR
jgi:arylsulfatase A